jgi:hypothetical protein
MLANWLYGVAHQTALKARATGAKRQTREKQVNQTPEPEVRSEPDPWRDLEPLLDAELSRLPTKYRLAIVLCDLEGTSRAEAARQLGIPEGTLSSRLTTARTMLARRLARHRVALSVGALGAVLSQNAAAEGLPPTVALSAIKAATAVAAGQAATAVVAAQVAALTDGVLKTMLLKKLTALMGILLLASALGLGSTVLLSGALGAGEPQRQETVSEGPAPQTQSEGAPGNDTRVPGAGVEDKGKDNKPEVKKPSPNEKARTLLKERLDILKEMQSRATKRYESGQAAYGTVLQINVRVLNAELDLCATDEERITVSEKMVAALKAIEKQAEEIAKQGAADPATVLEARLNRLEAEIALERLRAKAGKQKN